MDISPGRPAAASAGPSRRSSGAVPRILHIASTDRWTGLAEPLTSVALLQQRRGCDVRLACVQSRSFEREAKRRGLPFESDFYLERGFKVGWHLHDIASLRRMVREQGIHVVHTHLNHDHWIAMLALRGMKQPTLLARTYHRGSQDFHTDPLHRWLFNAGADLLITISQEMTINFIKRMKTDPAKVRLIYGGVDTQRFHPSRDGDGFRAVIGVDANAPLAGIVARMSPGRGHEHLLRAFSQAAARNKDLRLALIGRGPLKRALREQAASMPHGDRVIFAGYWSEKLPEAFAGLDFHVILVPGSDGSCRAALESMASGRANIASRKGVLPETVADGDDGILVKSDSEEQLANAMVRLAGSREVAISMGRNARLSAERRFREEVRAAATMRAYAERWKAKWPEVTADSPDFSIGE